MAILRVILKVGAMNKENINTHKSNVLYFINDKNNQVSPSEKKKITEKLIAKFPKCNFNAFKFGFFFCSV